MSADSPKVRTHSAEPIRSYQEFLERYLPEEAKRRRRERMTPFELGQDIAHEALKAAEADRLLQAMADSHQDCDDTCSVRRLADALERQPCGTPEATS